MGTLSAIGAFSMWGVLPLYWIQIRSVPALEVLWHRVFWGAVVAWIIVLYRRRRRLRSAVVAGATATASTSTSTSAATLGAVPRSVPTPEPAWEPVLPPLFPRGRVLSWLVLNGVLVVTNWFVYIWAVSSGRTLDASLGYYINPLVSVLLGMVFFGDRLTRLQWGAVAGATAGVLFLTIRLGVFPWVSLALAGTFGTYGLIKKRTSLTPIHSLAVELSALSVVAAVAIGLGIAGGSGVPANGEWRAAMFLLGAGVVTVAPLLLFGMAAQRIRLSDVGFLQYIAPTLMFLIALTVFGDPLEPARLVGFVLVWIGLAMYTYSNYRSR
ncbi:MAG: EamA family transporter RarD, partial [Phycisphaeraceae bacterium]